MECLHCLLLKLDMLSALRGELEKVVYAWMVMYWNEVYIHSIAYSNEIMINDKKKKVQLSKEGANWYGSHVYCPLPSTSSSSYF